MIDYTHVRHQRHQRHRKQLLLTIINMQSTSTVLSCLVWRPTSAFCVGDRPTVAIRHRPDPERTWLAVGPTQFPPPNQTRQNSPVCVVFGVAVWISFNGYVGRWGNSTVDDLARLFLRLPLGTVTWSTRTFSAFSHFISNVGLLCSPNAKQRIVFYVSSISTTL